MEQDNIFYNSRNRKAQAAIEYLMTYGWMLLAVGILGTTAYTTLGVGCVPTVTGFEGDAATVEDFGVDTEGEFQLLLENNAREEIQIQKITVNMTNRGQAVSTTTVPIESGRQEAELIGEGFATTEEECNTLEVELEYDREPLQDVTATGTIEAPITATTPPPQPLFLNIQENP